MRLLSAAAFLVVSMMAGGAYAGDDPQALVEKTSNLMLAKLKEEREILKARPGRIYELVNEIILPHFDFEYMSQIVLAKYWRQASASQRKAFTQEFKTLLVRTYATSLNEYTDQVITYLPYRPSAQPGQAKVQSEIEQPGGFPIPIDYRLRNKNSDWKVFDITIEGVSLVTNYRTSFAKEIREGGIDSLIKTLADRNKEAASE